MISALRGWRRKKRPSLEEFTLNFERFTDKINKHVFMRKVNGTRYGRAQLIHKGRKP